MSKDKTDDLMILDEEVKFQEKVCLKIEVEPSLP